MWPGVTFLKFFVFFILTLVLVFRIAQLLKHVFQLLLFQLLHNTIETISVFAVHADAVLLKQQRMFVVGAKREQIC